MLVRIVSLTWADRSSLCSEQFASLTWCEVWSERQRTLAVGASPPSTADQGDSGTRWICCGPGRSAAGAPWKVVCEEEEKGVWTEVVSASVCVCVCALPGEERTPNLLSWLSFKGRARHTRGCLWSAAPSIPHFPSLSFTLSLLHPSFPRLHHLSLVPSAFSPRFLGPPSLCSLICCVGPLWSLYGNGSHLQILPKSSDST